MLHAKKTLFVLPALFGLEFLFLGFFTNGIFSWTVRHVAPLLKGAAGTPERTVQLNFPAKIVHGFALEGYNDRTPRSAGFLIANENAKFSLKNLTTVPLRFRVILAPRVSRYISKSVLNI
jgi:uncharacterized membrane protein YedE/YeeE